MTLTATRPKDRVLIECIQIRLQGALNSWHGDLVFNEQFRFHLEKALLDQKIEYPHDHEVQVKLINKEGRPAISIVVGDLELYELEN